MGKIKFGRVEAIALVASCCVGLLASIEAWQSNPVRANSDTVGVVLAEGLPTRLAMASDMNYLSTLEQGIIAEMNLARTNPNAYADKLVQLKQYFDGNTIRRPGEIGIITQEGVSAVDEAIDFLRSASPVSPLNPSRGMSLGARDLVSDQGPQGGLGHTGSDGSQPWDRVSRYGEWQMSIGENVSYGPNTAERVVTQLIIDDGVPNRGHRTNIFKPDFAVTGVACGDHAKFRSMCVITYAGGYDEG
ncbi:MAG: CAP domain-containing protein [Symploca sp. SIO2E6]|nr:CAP domain-containing protein [Symploca sp. SIO2E6]